jgi:hypothetical protein
MNRDILFVYDHFYPDYSAGGPVTSLVNLAHLLKSSCNVRILTSSRYYNTGKSFENIPLNQWTTQNGFTVWYADSSKSIDQAIDSIQPGTTVYLNGIFSRDFFLRILRKSKLDIIVSPRGMLQKGALANKSLKKTFYIFLLKTAGLLKRVRWHATDAQEKADITSQFGKCPIEVIPNVPRLPVAVNTPINKTPGVLKLVCFSLISRKKNIGFLIDILATSKFAGITLDIVGPIKDVDYWRECQPAISRCNGTVNHLGDCDPANVNELLSHYHLFVLPTHGENFGHAIMEAMSTYRPVLISDLTPWKDVESDGGGFAIPLVTSKWEGKLTEARDWSQQDFDKACVGAMNYFRRNIDMHDLESRYVSLFSNKS